MHGQSFSVKDEKDCAFEDITITTAGISKLIVSKTKMNPSF